MRRVSFNMRRSQDAMATELVQVILVKITHPALDAPIRLSTDPNERLSLDPLEYGTRSTWQTDDGSPFRFVLMGADLPGDQEDAPAAATLVLDATGSDAAQVLRSTVKQARVDMACVLASSPDLVEFEVSNLLLVAAEGEGGTITLQISRDPLTSKPYPADRMTRQRMPGMHK